jgi:hypothetical protein
MEKIIDRISTVVSHKTEIVNARAETANAYDKARAIQSAIHKDAGVPATLNKMQADGDTGDLKEEMLKADGNYKAFFEILSCYKAQLNAYQSIYKHLDNTGI